MRRETAVVATGLGIGLVLAQSEVPVLQTPMTRPPYPVTWHVDTADTVAATKFTNQRCILQYGAAVVPTPYGLIYSDRMGEGSECPNGAILDVPIAQAQTQEAGYRQLEARKRAIATALLAEEYPKEPARSVQGRVVVSNPQPITKTYIDQSYELWRYGKTCKVDGVALRVGKLASGEIIWRLSTPTPAESVYDPSSCPQGTVFTISE